MINTAHSHPGRTSATRRRLGLPFIVLIGLALLGAPRVVLHDFGVLTEGTAINAVFVFVPLVIWIVVALWQRVPQPFLTLLVVGALYGVILLFIHQILWDVGFGSNMPRLGGNLAGLDDRLQAVIIRFFAGLSSLFTGAIVGAITGLIAWGLGALTGRTRPVPRPHVHDGR